LPEKVFKRDQASSARRSDQPITSPHLDSQRRTFAGEKRRTNTGPNEQQEKEGGGDEAEEAAAAAVARSIRSCTSAPVQGLILKNTAKAVNIKGTSAPEGRKHHRLQFLWREK